MSSPESIQSAKVRTRKQQQEKKYLLILVTSTI